MLLLLGDRLGTPELCWSWNNAGNLVQTSHICAQMTMHIGNFWEIECICISSISAPVTHTLQAYFHIHVPQAMGSMVANKQLQSTTTLADLYSVKATAVPYNIQ